tara:strand:- start:380 stop:2689 length:2310 start_codon:yes stop_codon:yes gene_type:complete
MANTTVDTLLIQIKADMKSLKAEMDKIKKVSDNTSKNVSKGFDNINKKLSETSSRALKVGAAIGTAFAGVAVKKIIGVGSEVENLQIRLNNLFGSAEEGSKAFDEMAKFAAKVPFSLQQIQMGSGALAAVADDSEHLAELLQITGNVAAVTGLDFATTSMQIQRSFSAGIGAADLFRERAVGSLLGFQKGAEVTVEETVKAFTENFGEGGKFGKTTDQLANTLTGTLSMIGDKVFSFQRLIADEGFFNEVKSQFKELDTFLAENGETIDQLAKDISLTLISALKGLVSTIKFVAENSETLKIALQALLGAFVALKITKTVTAMMLAYKTATIGATGATVALTAAMRVNPLFLAIGAGAGVLTAVIANLDKIKNKLEEIAEVPRSPALESFGAMDTSGAPDFTPSAQAGFAREGFNFQKLLAARPDKSEAFKKVKGEIEEELHLLGLRNDKEREFFKLIKDNEVTQQHEITMLREKFDALKDLEETQTLNNEIMQDAQSIIDGAKTEQEKLNEQIAIFSEQLNKVADEDIKGKLTDAIAILKEDLRQLDPLMQEITQIFDRASTSISQAIADSITEGKNLMQSLGNITKQVVNQMIAEFLRLKVIQPLISSIFGGGQQTNAGGTGSIGGFIGSLFGGGGGGGIMSLFGGGGGGIQAAQGFGQTASFMLGGAFSGRAGGGTIAPNRAVMVGERGPEIFVPNSGGKIVPNHNMKALGGQETVINQNINITTGVSQTVRAEVLNMLPAIKQETLQAVADSRLRGGTFGAAFTR